MNTEATAILKHARDLLDPKQKRSSAIAGGFAWWGRDIRTEAVICSLPDQPPIFRIGSDMWKGFEGSPSDMALLSSILKDSTLSAPARMKTDPTRLGLWVDIPLDQEKGSWMAGFLALVAAQQNAEAARFARIGQAWKADSCNLGSNEGIVPSPYAEIETELLTGLGRRDSLFGKDVGLIAEQMESESLFNVHAGIHGVSAEVNLGSQTALLRFLTKQPHPRLGNGLFCFLTIPLEADPSLAMRMNELGLGSVNPIYGPGSWCVGEVGLTHLSFYPNAIYRDGLSSWVVDWSVQRARWIVDVILGTVFGGTVGTLGGRNLPLYQSLIEIYRGEHATP